MRRILTLTLLVAAAAGAAVGGARLLRPAEREVSTSSEQAYQSYREGMDNTSRFRLEKAYDSFAKAVELDPDFAVAHMRLALAARELGRQEAFQEHRKKAYELRDQGTEIERLWIERISAVIDGDHEKGQELYAEMEAAYPDHPWVLRLKAEFAKMNGRFDEALAAYERILEQEPENVDIHNLKGYLFLAEGDYEQAIQSLERYAYYAPDQANPHDSLGEAFLRIGRYEEAIKEFKQALDIDPTFVWSGVHLSEALGITGQFQSAQQVLDIIEPVFEERGWDNWLTMQRMKVDALAERWQIVLQEAESHLPIDVATLEPKDIEFAMTVNYVRTVAYLELGDLQSAREAVSGITELVEKVREMGASYRDMDPIITLNRNYIECRFARAEGEPERGIEPLRASIAASKLSPDELAFFRRELVEALIAAERYDEAAQEANVVLEVIPTQPELNLLAAQAYVAAGNPDAAIEHLEIYADVMRRADEGHPRVAEATRLYDRVAPRS